MYHNWLDQWDERRAQRGDEEKKATAFALGADLAFPSAKKVETIDEFCVLADQALADPAFFGGPVGGDQSFQRQDEWLKFASDISTDIAENNVVCAKITESGSLERALVAFHHWNARSRNNQIARFLSKRGITVVEIAMPYHFERSRPGATHADYMLSPNLGRTIQSVRQAVLDGRKLIRWLKREGYEEISVLGMSLGSWVAGLIAAQEVSVSKASLFLTAGRLADMVWTGRATRSIRESLEGHIELADLRKAWAPLDMENFAYQLARPGLELQIVIAKRDRVVIPKLSRDFIYSLERANVKTDIIQINCGHYSMGIPPFVLLAGWALKKFLKTPRLSTKAIS